MDGADGFPVTAQQFYLARDHRTSLYVEHSTAYQTVGVRVTADEGVARTVAGQVALLVSCNLLARWCRRVHLDFEDAPLIQRPSRVASLREAAIELMRNADPFGHFTNDILAPEAELHLHVGTAAPAGSRHTTLISFAGWCAAVRRVDDPPFPARDSANVAGAVFASILGGAQLFRDALGKPQLYPRGFIFDCFLAMPVTEVATHAPTPDSADFGHALLIGSGSVASAALYFFRLLGLRGLVDAVDRDSVKIENFGRSPIFGRPYFGLPKASAIADHLKGHIEVRAIEQWWDEFLPSSNLRRYDLWLPLANERNVRWEMQTAVPPLMIQASTGPNWDVVSGRHIPGRDDCLADRFAGLADRAAFKCSDGEVTTAAGTTMDAALPFLSFFAGALIAVDVLRLQMGGYPHTMNYTNYSFRGTRFTPHSYDYRPRPECICNTQGEARRALRGHLRYAHLPTTR
jgi:hypothetical protein